MASRKNGRSVGNNPTDPVGEPKLQTVADPAGAHEEQDVHPKYLFAFLGVLVVVITVVMLLMVAMFDFFEARVAATDPPGSPLANQRPKYEGVKLETRFTSEIDQMRKEQEAVLTSYGWVVEQEGIVRVPVGVAMEAVAKNGLPDWSQQAEPESEADE